MITIKQTTASQGIPTAVFFERTNEMREKISHCTREELIDLTFHYLEIIEKAHGQMENQVDVFETSLGYKELMR